MTCHLVECSSFYKQELKIRGLTHQLNFFSSLWHDRKILRSSYIMEEISSNHPKSLNIFIVFGIILLHNNKGIIAIKRMKLLHGPIIFRRIPTSLPTDSTTSERIHGLWKRYPCVQTFETSRT